MSQYNSIYPNYKINTLVNLMASILKHFNIQNAYPPLDDSYFDSLYDCDKLIFLFIDGFGFNIWDRYAKNNTLFRVLDKNMKNNSISTIFPSTTSAGLTTVHTSLPPKEHGIIEWNVYFKEFNAVISPLAFNAVSPMYNRITYKEDTNSLINVPTIYEKLSDNSIPSFVFYPKQFITGVFNTEAMKGANKNLYIFLTDLFLDLLTKIESIKGKAYFFIYWPYLDTTEHVYGPFTPQTDMHIKMFHDMFQEYFLNKLKPASARKTGLILSADHGHIDCNPQEAFYLNQIKSLSSFLDKTSEGLPILPSGNVRDLFLHIQRGKLETCHTELSVSLKEIADVIQLDSSAIKRLFGTSKTHPAFYDRIGNLLILPKDNKVIAYQYHENNLFTYKGTHGGLTEDEMKIPLITSPLSALQ